MQGRSLSLHQPRNSTEWLKPEVAKVPGTRIIEVEERNSSGLVLVASCEHDMVRLDRHGFGAVDRIRPMMHLPAVDPDNGKIAIEA